jgi:hypothetical protein
MALRNAPKQGTITGKVWEICTSMYLASGSVPTRGQVLAAGIEQGINVNTITTQYQAWKTYTGLGTAAAARVEVPCVAVPKQG